MQICTKAHFILQMFTLLTIVPECFVEEWNRGVKRFMFWRTEWIISMLFNGIVFVSTFFICYKDVGFRTTSLDTAFAFWFFLVVTKKLIFFHTKWYFPELYSLWSLISNSIYCILFIDNRKYYPNGILWSYFGRGCKINFRLAVM